MIRDGARELAEAHGALRLREVEAGDSPDLFRWRMEPTARAQFRHAEVASWSAHQEFFDAYFRPECRDRWFVVEAEGQAVGAIALYGFSADGTEAEWGRFVIAPEYRGRGWGRRALTLLLGHARELGVRRLRCEVLAGNSRAESLYRSLGFVAAGAAHEVGRRCFLPLVSSLAEPAAEPIHLFVPTFRVDECLAEVRECLERGWTGLGYKTVAFEQAWRDYSGLPHAHFLASATAGLHLALRILGEANGWQAGDEVITTPLTFVSTNHAILYEGLRPRFADVDEHLCLDPAAVAASIGPRTRAVCFVGLGGNPGRYREVRDLCRRRGLALVLDAAHMAGTRLDGRHAGGDADAAVFSFHAVKNLPTADAGMLCFAEPAHDAAARKWSWLGIGKDTYTRTLSGDAYKWLYDVEHVGFKYHGNSIMASLGLVGLRYLETDNADRRRLAAWYDEELAGAAGIETVPMAPGSLPSRHLYQVQVERRDGVILALNAEGIFPGVHYRDNTQYRMYAESAGTCPRALRASERLISLPLHLRLGRPEVARVAAALKRAVSGAAAPQPQS